MISFIHNESEIGWGIASKPKAQNRKQKNQKNISLWNYHQEHFVVIGGGLTFHLLLATRWNWLVACYSL